MTLAVEDLAKFTIADQAGFDADFNANQNDFMGAACLRHGARWAHAMEREMASGLTLDEAATKTRFAPDVHTEGVTGLMEGFAIGFLTHCWIHAQEFRAWVEANP